MVFIVTDATYAWLVTEDHISDPGGGIDKRTRIGLEGPSDAPEGLLELLRRGEGHRWRCHDDDGNLYYAGLFLDSENGVPQEGEYGLTGMGDSGFGPLDDFCKPDAGAVTIEYLIPYKTPQVTTTVAFGKWQQL